MSRKILSYSYEEVLAMLLQDASKRTCLPVNILKGSVGENGSYVERRDGNDLMELPHRAIEPLHISPQCRGRYKGAWVGPAQLNQEQINEILDRLPAHPRSILYKLLIEHKNGLGMVVSSGGHLINKALREPIAGKYYRLASGTNRAGRHRDQLWEVQPTTT